MSIFRVQELLRQLGDTPQDVANHLLKRQHRGRRDVADACPVANYLTASGMPGCLVGPGCIYRSGGRLIDLPHSVLLFVQQFDAGMHDELLDV